MRNAKENSNYSNLKEFLVAYARIPSLIRHKKKLLKFRLLNPQTDTIKGFHAFVCKENEIEYLINLHSEITNSINKLNDSDRYLCKLVLQEPNMYRICSKLKVSNRTYFRKVEKLWDYFQNEINQKEIIWEK